MLKTFYHRSKAKKQVQDSHTLLAVSGVGPFAWKEGAMRIIFGL